MRDTHTSTRRIAPALLWVIALVLATVFGSGIAEARHEEESEVDVYLTLLHNNDGESALLPSVIEGEPFGGVAPFATLVDDLRDEGSKKTWRGPDRVSLLVSSGDNYLAGAQFQASLEKGRPFYDAIAMDIIGYDALAIGNHEFDFGPDVFADFVRSFRGKDPFVSANLDFSAEPGLDRLVRKHEIVKSVVVKERGERFGIVGATTPALPIISSPRDVIVNEVLPAVQAEVDRLEQKGIDKIILISHLQSITEDLELAAQLDDVDIMVAGGGDELLANDDDLLVPGDGPAFGPYPIIATDVDGTEIPVVTTSGSYRYVGRLVVGFDDDGNVLEIDPSSGPVRVTSGSLPDAVEPDRKVTRKVVEPIQAFVDALATPVVAQTEVPLNSARGSVAVDPVTSLPLIPIQVTAPGERVSETNLGKLAADSLLWQAQQLAGDFGADSPVIAFQNGGGIRLPDDLRFPDAAPGNLQDVTRLEINNQFPFPNFVTIVADVPVTQIKAVLENAVSNVEGRDGRFAHVAGMTYEWDSTGTAGVDRVRAFTIDGVPVYDADAGGFLVDEATTYDVATIDFLANGGDGYDFGGAATTNVGVTYEQAVLDYLSGPLGGIINQADYANVVGTRIVQSG